MRKNNQYYIRKTHRWLGVIIGIQFIGWTVSGLFFSWSDIDDIHGDHFIQEDPKPAITSEWLNSLDSGLMISEISLRHIGDRPHLWINDSLLIDAQTGLLKEGINQKDAEQIAVSYLVDDLTIRSIELLTEVGSHHEYREMPLPAWAIHFDGNDHVTAYITQRDGRFHRVRHSSWRIFDFLWMFHTMDYQGRDDFNNWLLRAFSLFGLFTVGSGFTLFFVTARMQRKRKIKQN